MTKPARRLHAALERAAELAAEADSPRTRQTYRESIRAWIAFAEREGLDPKPPISPDAIAAWIGAQHEAGLARSTIKTRCSAVARLHRDQGLDSPCDFPIVRRVLRGLSRSTAPAEGKTPLTAAMVRRALLHDKTHPRYRAILAVGFVTGMRRSELVALTWEHVQEHPEGLVLEIPFGKTDQTGRGASVAVPFGKNPDTCPARVLLRWGSIVGTEGSVFRCGVDTVNRAVKYAAKLAGQDPGDYGAHSLRAGLLTAASDAGIMLPVVMQASRHKSPAVAASYVRHREALRNPAFRAVVDALGRSE